MSKPWFNIPPPAPAPVGQSPAQPMYGKAGSASVASNVPSTHLPSHASLGPPNARCSGSLSSLLMPGEDTRSGVLPTQPAGPDWTSGRFTIPPPTAATPVQMNVSVAPPSQVPDSASVPFSMPIAASDTIVDSASPMEPVPANTVLAPLQANAALTPLQATTAPGPLQEDPGAAPTQAGVSLVSATGATSAPPAFDGAQARNAPVTAPFMPMPVLSGLSTGGMLFNFPTTGKAYDPEELRRRIALAPPPPVPVSPPPDTGKEAAEEPDPQAEQACLALLKKLKKNKKDGKAKKQK